MMQPSSVRLCIQESFYNLFFLESKIAIYGQQLSFSFYSFNTASARSRFLSVHKASLNMQNVPLCPHASTGKGTERVGFGFGTRGCVWPTECTAAGNGWHFCQTWIQLLPMGTEPCFWMTFPGVPAMEPCGVSGSTQRAAAAPAGQPRSSLSHNTQQSAQENAIWIIIIFFLVDFIYENGTQTFGMMWIGFSFWKEALCSFIPPRSHNVINLILSKNENGIWDSTNHTVYMHCRECKSMKICFQLV